MELESARFHGIVIGESLKRILLPTMYFCCRTTRILKTLGQFENLVSEIMSTTENIRLIARTPLTDFTNNNYFNTFAAKYPKTIHQGQACSKDS